MLAVSDEGAASAVFSGSAGVADESVFPASEAVLLASDADGVSAGFIAASDVVLSLAGAIVDADGAGFASSGLFSLQDATPVAAQLRTATTSTLPNLFTSFLSSCRVFDRRYLQRILDLDALRPRGTRSPGQDRTMIGGLADT
jgi:hypothetical protein